MSELRLLAPRAAGSRRVKAFVLGAYKDLPVYFTGLLNTPSPAATRDTHTLIPLFAQWVTSQLNTHTHTHVGLVLVRSESMPPPQLFIQDAEVPPPPPRSGLPHFVKLNN